MSFFFFFFLLDFLFLIDLNNNNKHFLEVFVSRDVFRVMYVLCIDVSNDENDFFSS